METFRDFMESALYHPRNGFYAKRAPSRDFYTAPELHPSFADILTAEICSQLEKLAARRPNEPLFIVEMGSGNGTLARQILRALRDLHPRWHKRARYVLVERVEPLLLESLISVSRLADRILGYTRLSDIPPLCGVLFSNELIDAMPVHLLEKREGKVQEVYVDDSGASRVGAFSRKELARSAKAVAARLPEGGRHAVNLEMSAWLKRVSRLLKSGTLITIDYGKLFPRQNPNPPRAFYRHTTSYDVLTRAHQQDLTASVDFSRLNCEGQRLGFKTASFTTLARFLLERGIVELLPTGNTPADYQERNRIKTLFHPEGMGDIFKVLIQEKI